MTKPKYKIGDVVYGIILDKIYLCTINEIIDIGDTTPRYGLIGEMSGCNIKASKVEEGNLYKTPQSIIEHLL